MRGVFVHEIVHEFGHPGMSDFMSEKKAPIYRAFFGTIEAHVF